MYAGGRRGPRLGGAGGSVRAQCETGFEPLVRLGECEHALQRFMNV